MPRDVAVYFILFILIALTTQYLVKSENYETPYYSYACLRAVLFSQAQFLRLEYRPQHHLYCSRSVRGYVSCMYKTIGTVTVLYVLTSSVFI